MALNQSSSATATATNLDELALSISSFFDYPFGQLLRLFCEHTGQRWGIVPPELFWFRPPGMHVFEALFFAPFLYTLWLWFGVPCTKKLLGDGDGDGDGYDDGSGHKSKLQQKNATAARNNNNRQSGMNSSFSATSPTPNGGSNAKPMFGMDFLCGLIMIMCYGAQVFFKITRPNPFVQLCWMAVPCHLITFTWAYILLSPPSWNNYRTCRFLAALLAMSSWGGIAASLFPDWSDHQYWIEGPIFYIHHFVLVLLPHYWAAKHGMLPLTWQLFWTYIVVALGINFFVYTPLSYISGVNVNYNLHPHLKMSIRTQWYRFLVPSVLAIWAVFYWYMTYIANRLYYRVFVGGGGANSTHEVLTPLVRSPNRPSNRSPLPSASPNDNHHQNSSASGITSPTAGRSASALMISGMKTSAKESNTTKKASTSRSSSASKKNIKKKV